MAIRARIADSKTIVLTGGTPDELGVAAKAVGKRIALAIANNFQNMRTWGGTLRANKPEYDLRKILRGGSPLRGHDTGALQKALTSAPLYYLRAGAHSVRLVFTDSALKAAIPYAKYYAASKVVGGRIAGVPKRWEGDLNTFLGTLRRAPSRRSPKRTVSKRSLLVKAVTRRTQQRNRVEVR